MELTSQQEKILEEQYQVNRTRMFKGTIAISVVYGAIALFFVLLMFTTEKSKQILGVDLFAFSVTFIAGVVVIITLLVIQILTFKKETPKTGFDIYQCPDYWELVQTDPNVVKKFPSELRPYFQYACKPSPKIFDVNNTVTTTPSATGANAQPQLDEAYTEVNRTQPNAMDHMSCKLMYPGYMAYKDGKLNEKQPNKMRCDYANFCKASWSSVCQNM
jgi:hypothetical protein